MLSVVSGGNADRGVKITCAPRARHAPATCCPPPAAPPAPPRNPLSGGGFRGPPGRLGVPRSSRAQARP